MGGRRDWFEELVTAPLRDELGRALGKVTRPVHAKVDQVVTDTAKRVFAPVHRRIDHEVDHLADAAVDRITSLLWPRGKRRR
jgi:hypothetical protein